MNITALYPMRGPQGTRFSLFVEPKKIFQYFAKPDDQTTTVNWSDVGMTSSLMSRQRARRIKSKYRVKEEYIEGFNRVVRYVGWGINKASEEVCLVFIPQSVFTVVRKTGWNKADFHVRKTGVALNTKYITQPENPRFKPTPQHISLFRGTSKKYCLTDIFTAWDRDEMLEMCDEPKQPILSRSLILDIPPA